jgi:hypothetical protein
VDFFKKDPPSPSALLSEDLFQGKEDMDMDMDMDIYIQIFNME